MDAQKTGQRIVIIFIILTRIVGSFAFAGTVRIYGRDFHLTLLDPPGPGSAMTQAIIEVPYHFLIVDLDVKINITHTKVFDLQLILQSPDQMRLTLNKYDFNEYFEGANYIQTVFDDEAELSIKDAVPPFTGWFKPRDGKLEIFDALDSYGNWTLQIYDMWPADTGYLDSFQLIFTIPEPSTVILLSLGFCWALFLKPRRKPFHSP